MKILAKIFHYQSWNADNRDNFSVYLYAIINIKTGLGKKISKDKYLKLKKNENKQRLSKKSIKNKEGKLKK